MIAGISTTNGTTAMFMPGRSETAGTETFYGLMATAMLPLWSRAQEALQPQPLFVDERAIRLAELLALDYSTARDVDRIQTSIAIRSRIVDDRLREYLRDYPDAVIVNLGAGFDCRYYRMDNGTVLWYDLDFPQLLEVKRIHCPETQRYRMLEKSLLDFSWLDQVDSVRRPVLLLAEGVLMYLHEHELRRLLDALAGRFPGAQLLFELLAPGAVGYQPLMNNGSPEFKWTLLRARDISAMNPKVRYRREWCILDYYQERWQGLGFLTDFSMLRNYFGERIVHLELQ
jgi:O-methyltransferase involved in polyketide biosynthesis